MTWQNPGRDELTGARRLAAIERRLHALETAPRARALFATRPTDSAAVVSSTVVHEDEQLTLAPRAGTTYTLSGLLMWVGDVTGDIQVGFTFPQPATLHWGVVGPSEAGLTTPADVTRGAGQWWARHGQTTSPTATIQYAASTAVMLGHLTGELITGASATGPLTMRWAQNTSSATGLVMKTGSWIKLTPERT